MTLDIDQEIAALRQMTVCQLRSQHQELFGEPPRSAHKQHLVRRIVRSQPERPIWRPLYAARGVRIESWSRFVSESYWNVELQEK